MVVVLRQLHVIHVQPAKLNLVLKAEGTMPGEKVESPYSGGGGGHPEHRFAILEVIEAQVGGRH